MDSYIEADGLITFYVKQGSGFSIVLFHGAAPGASAEVNWQLNIEALAAAGFTVYAYDQAGFGRTNNPTDLSIEYRVTHAKAFIDALKLERYHVIGNSVGGISPRAWRSKIRVSRSSSRRQAAHWRPKARRNLKHCDRGIPKNFVNTCQAWRTCELSH